MEQTDHRINREIYNINKNVINKARKCDQNYSCLQGDDVCMCKVDDCANSSVLFVSPLKKDTFCPYLMSFGNALICKCPVRLEIYKNHRG